MVVHELYGHSYQADRGELNDREINLISGIKESEHSAVDAENIFNRDAGRPEEKCYGNKPLDGKSPCSTILIVNM